MPDPNAALAATVHAHFATLWLEWNADRRPRAIMTAAGEVAAALYALADRRGTRIDPAPAVRTSADFQIDSANKAARRLTRFATAVNWVGADREIQVLHNCLWLFCQEFGWRLDDAVEARRQRKGAAA